MVNKFGYKLKIIYKIEKELKNLDSEAQVVYILTQIFRIIESKNQEVEYPCINFYRNWTVHSKIDRNFKPQIKLILLYFIKNPGSREFFLFHNELILEMFKFFKEHSVSELDVEQVEKFIFLLSKVLSDTPVKIKIDNSIYIVELSEPKNIGKTGVYKIDVEVNVPFLK